MIWSYLVNTLNPGHKDQCEVYGSMPVGITALVFLFTCCLLICAAAVYWSPLHLFNDPSSLKDRYSSMWIVSPCQRLPVYVYRSCLLLYAPLF